METQPTPSPAPQRTTAAGTPCSSRWPKSWIAVVDAIETSLGHRICGAVLDDGMPCRIPPDHPNGRCRFHGGNLMIGARSGNQHARVHGLYQRRLQTCGPHCLQWHSCPFSGDEILNLPEESRPKCAFEQAEYEGLIRDYFDYNLQDIANPALPVPQSEEDPYEVHQLIMLQILMTRAAAALAQGSITERIATASGPVTKTNPAFEALMRTTREYRQLRTAKRKRGRPRKSEPCIDVSSNPATLEKEPDA